MPQDAQAATFSIRRGSSVDFPLIFATWLRSYRHTSTFAAPLANEVYFPSHHTIVEKLLSRSTIYVACLPDDQNVVLGYLVYEVLSKPIIHYIYVKEAFRREGIATAMIKAAQLDPNECFYTHRTYACDWLVGSHVHDQATGKKVFKGGKHPGCAFNPYLAFGR